MFGLFYDSEVNYIFSNNDDGPVEIAYKAYESYKERPGFFTPYKNVAHFVGGIAAPVIYPVAGGFAAVYSLFVAAGSALVCAGTLLVAGVARLLGCADLCDNSFLVAGCAFKFIGAALLNAAVSALLCIFSIPNSVATLVTRTGATLASLTVGYTDGYEEREEYKEEDNVLPCFI